MAEQRQSVYLVQIPQTSASCHIAHLSRRSTYPGPQARETDVEYFHRFRKPRDESSGQEQSESIPDEDHSAISIPPSETIETNLWYGSSAAWSNRSRASLSGLSEDSVDRRDSISNQDSKDGGDFDWPRSRRIPRSAPPPPPEVSSSSRRDPQTADPHDAHRTQSNITPLNTQKHARPSSSSSQNHPQNRLASYSEQPRDRRNRHDSSGVEAYDDDFIDPFTPWGCQSNDSGSSLSDRERDAQSEDWEGELKS